MSEPNQVAQAVHYEFVLILPGLSEIRPAEMDALFEAGCDDATASMRNGRVYLALSREAPSFKDAMFSAIADVSRARIGAHVLMVNPCKLASQS